MAITQTTYTGNGSTTNYSFTFEYLKQADVKVTLDTVATTAFTFANATTLAFTTAPTNGAVIRIFRDTPSDTLSSTFFPGSAIKAEDLNENFTQNLYVTQESDAEAAAATTTANGAVTTANSAVTTANGAVTTANSADTKSDAAVATANTSNTNSTAAVATANTASSNATAAVNTANTASTNATAAVNTANAATTTANGAVTTANSAATDAATGISTANGAVTTANTALANAATATTTANGAVTTANAATTTAGNAVTTANAAVSTANTANTSATAAVATANAAQSAVSSAAFYSPVANVAGIPGSPSDTDRVEVADSTGIQSFTPLAGYPVGFTGSSGLTARIQYSSSGSTWNWVDYFANDPENRYLTESLPVVKGDSTNGSGQITLNCENNSHGIKIKGPPHSAGANYTLTLPNDTGTANQTLNTDGSGSLSWSTPDQIGSGVGFAKIQHDTNSQDELQIKLENQIVRTDKHTHSFVYKPQYISDNVEIRGDKTLAFQIATGGGSYFTAFKKSQSASSSATFTLPDTDGTSGQALKTDGSGVLSFSDIASSIITQTDFAYKPTSNSLTFDDGLNSTPGSTASEFSFFTNANTGSFSFMPTNASIKSNMEALQVGDSVTLDWTLPNGTTASQTTTVTNRTAQPIPSGSYGAVVFANAGTYHSSSVASVKLTCSRISNGVEPIANNQVLRYKTATSKWTVDTAEVIAICDGGNFANGSSLVQTSTTFDGGSF